MDDLLVSALRNIGPCVSSEFVAALVKDYGLSPANARKRLSRTEGIKKLAYLPFPHNARFLYLQDDYASPEFWNALTSALLQHSMSYGGGLAALIARGGVMPVAHFAIACGAPDAQKGHVSAAAVLSRLKEAKLVQTFQAQGLGECVELSQTQAIGSSELAKMRARIKGEEVLLSAVKDWARNLGLVSYNLVALRDELERKNRVGTFHWDMTAPTFLGGLAQWEGKKPKPGFLACDVLLGTNVSAQDLQPFVKKCKTLRMLPNVGRCMQVFVADGYTRDAFLLAKQEGIVPATTSTLFGTDVAKALRELIDVLSDVYPRHDTVAKVEEVFKRLSHIEGAATNLRGALFEYLVAEAVRLDTSNTDVRLNEIYRVEDGRTVEVDVFAHQRNKSVTFIECKGYKPGGTVPDEMVQRWLRDRVPLMRKVAEAHPDWAKCKPEFEFWTTGRLTPEATSMVVEEAKRTRKFKLTLVDQIEVKRRVDSTNNTGLKRTLNEHFLEHPFEKADREVRKPKKLPKPATVALAKRKPDDLEFANFLADDKAAA